MQRAKKSVPKAKSENSVFFAVKLTGKLLTKTFDEWF